MCHHFPCMDTSFYEWATNSRSSLQSVIKLNSLINSLNFDRLLCTNWRGDAAAPPTFIAHSKHFKIQRCARGRRWLKHKRILIWGNIIRSLISILWGRVVPSPPPIQRLLQRCAFWQNSRDAAHWFRWPGKRDPGSNTRFRFSNKQMKRVFSLKET